MVHPYLVLMLQGSLDEDDYVSTRRRPSSPVFAPAAGPLFAPAAAANFRANLLREGSLRDHQLATSRCPRW